MSDISTASEIRLGSQAATELRFENKIVWYNPNFKLSFLPSYSNWVAINYGNNKFVALGSLKIAYSSNGINWTEVGSYSGIWESIAYGNNKFVAAGNSNDIIYSPDGITWAAAYNVFSVTNTGWSVCFGDNKFVAINFGSSQSAYSTDGINWVSSTLPVSQSWSAVTYGNGKFIAIARYSNTGAYSTDGINWISFSIPNTNGNAWKSVIFGNGKFVAVVSDPSTKGSAYSTDGINWVANALPVSSQWNHITFGNGKFMICGTGQTILYSFDGIIWKSKTLPTSTNWESISYGNNKFVAIAVDSNNYIYANG